MKDLLAVSVDSIAQWADRRATRGPETRSFFSQCKNDMELVFHI